MNNLVFVLMFGFAMLLPGCAITSTSTSNPNPNPYAVGFYSNEGLYWGDAYYHAGHYGPERYGYWESYGYFDKY
jgi:hypothetical protein